MDNRPNTSSWQHFLAGLRRIHRSALRRANWQYLPAYWQVQKYLSKLSFVLSRQRHSVNDRASASRESFQIVVLILRSAGGAACLALIIVVITGLVEVVLKRLFHASEPFAQTRPLLDFLFESIRQLHFDGNAAGGLLGTLAQIAGVLLGLYFAVVGTLVSTRYASVPPKIRELLVADIWPGIRWRFSVIMLLARASSPVTAFGYAALRVPAPPPRFPADAFS